MGLRDLFGPRKAASDTTNLLPPTINVLGETLNLTAVMGQSAAHLYRTQPHLRTVVSFVARNIAQLGLHTFERVADGDRRRDTAGVAAQLLRKPNPQMTTYDLINALVSELMLWDEAYWWVYQDPEFGWLIRPIPKTSVIGPKGGNAWGPEEWLTRAANGTTIPLPAKQVIVFHGWNPSDSRFGVSPVETLKVILAEQMSAWAFRAQQSKNGHRAGAQIVRPVGAPEWKPEQRAKFREDFKARYTGNGATDGGGTPMFEDGMELKSIVPTAKDSEFAEASKLAITTVAGVYHINPTMIGVLDNANYSNVKEFHGMLYGDSLGPTMAQLEATINRFLLPMLGEADNKYVEFNINEKLQGSFEEQAAVGMALVGGPTMTINEYRARQNLPRIEGGDVLYKPLNLGTSEDPDGAPKSLADLIELMHEQAQWKVTDWKIRTGPAAISPAAPKSIRPARKADESSEPLPADDPTVKLMRDFFTRQEKAVISAIGGAKAAGRKAAAAEWWDTERWNTELAADLYSVAMEVTPAEAAAVLAEEGLSPDEYDIDRTRAFLEAVAADRAEAINEATQEAISEALDSEDEEVTPAAVFEEHKTVKAVAIATSILTTYKGFARIEAAKQVAPDKATKTWRVTSSNPRKAHAKMDGETVGIGEQFSNGAEWPGDPVLRAGGVANCRCSVDVVFG